jgi:hypothetical protein
VGRRGDFRRWKDNIGIHRALVAIERDPGAAGEPAIRAPPPAEDQDG